MIPYRSKKIQQLPVGLFTEGVSHIPIEDCQYQHGSKANYFKRLGKLPELKI